MFSKVRKKGFPLTKCTSIIDNVIGCIPFQNFFDKIIEKISKTSKAQADCAPYSLHAIMKVLWIIAFVALFSCMWSVFIYFLVLWVNVPCFYNPMTQNYGWVHDSCMTVHLCYIIYLTSHKNCCKKLSIACHKFAHFFIIQMVWCLSFIFMKIQKLTLQYSVLDYENLTIKANNIQYLSLFSDINWCLRKLVNQNFGRTMVRKSSI